MGLEGFEIREGLRLMILKINPSSHTTFIHYHQKIMTSQETSTLSFYTSL
jgi:hypothetical protein